jgi:hypothetical protein
VEPGPPGPPFFLPLIEKEYAVPLTKADTEAGGVTFSDVEQVDIEEQFCGVTPAPIALNIQ